MKKSIMIILLTIGVIISLKVVFNVVFAKDKTIREDAEEKVKQFQREYNEGLLGDIYKKTCDSFKGATSKEEFLSIMNGKKELFGVFNKATLFYSNVINSKIVVLSYRSTYTHYSLVEEYTYSKENDSKLCLKSFYIDDSGKRGEVIKL